MFPALPLPSGIPRTHRLQWRNRFAALVPKSRPMSWNPGSTADIAWPQGSLCSFLSPSPQPPHMPLGLFFSWRTGFRNEVIRAWSCKQGTSHHSSGVLFSVVRPVWHRGSQRLRGPLMSWFPLSCTCSRITLASITPRSPASPASFPPLDHSH